LGVKESRLWGTIKSLSISRRLRTPILSEVKYLAKRFSRGETPGEKVGMGQDGNSRETRIRFLRDDQEGSLLRGMKVMDRQRSSQTIMNA